MEPSATEELPIVAEELATTIRCANDQCKAPLGRVHFFGSGGFVEFFLCFKCQQAGVRIENTTRGVTIRRLAKTKKS